MELIRHVAVLGAGTMGSRIAAHFANAGVPALLLDLAASGEDDRNAVARKGLETAAKQKPPAFYTTDARKLITVGNFDDDLERLGECDWVLEAVTEDLGIKQDLWRRVIPFLKPGTVLSTNTSGIPLSKIAEDFPQEFGRRFLGTHFFNPPRYLHRVELVPGPATEDDGLIGVSRFCDLRLGKGVVPCKDTPGFIANRLGAFFGATGYKLMTEGGYTIEEVDALTGPLIGLPKSASFRLLDLIGLDVWAFVLKNLYDHATEDPWRERFALPGFMQEMIDRGWLGRKSTQGFYRRTDHGMEVIDWRTLEYNEVRQPDLPSIENARQIEDLAERLRYLISTDDRAGDFVWKLLTDLFLYSAERVPEISDRVVEVDRAMRWGYAFTLGPFELWDALGFEETTRRMEKEGGSLPKNIQEMLSAGIASFYRPAGDDGIPRTEYFDMHTLAYDEVEQRPGIVSLAELKRARGVVKENDGASLIDLGDGVLCVEFHSKMNTLAEDAFQMVAAGIEETTRNFRAMVIANQGSHFSAGANLMTLLLAAQEGDWDEIDQFLRSFQQMNLSIARAPKPVVAAPFGHTLGGGCEVVLHAARAQASAELYMGLVETGVGLIPAGGGTTRLLARFADAGKAFDLIHRARVSSSAPDARRLGLLSPADGITMNPERLVDDAKQVALAVARSYVPAPPENEVEVGGRNVYAALKIEAWLAREAGRISEYDTVIAEKLAAVLSGGQLVGKQTVPEQYLLDLEREAFLSLCGNEKTRERIQHMLKTGKALRN